jgi:hypothetical protein
MDTKWALGTKGPKSGPFLLVANAPYQVQFQPADATLGQIPII